MTEEQLPKKLPPTLSEFIETNSKLVTSLAAFVALTIFALQQGGDDAEFVAAGALLGAVLLAYELFRNVPPRPRQWRLSLFEPIFLILMFGLGQFWLSRFKDIWIQIIIYGFLAIVGLLFFVVSFYAFRKMVRLFAIHVLRMHMSLNPDPFARPSGLLWLLAVAIFYIGIWWLISHRFAGRMFHVPRWLF